MYRKVVSGLIEVARDLKEIKGSLNGDDVVLDGGPGSGNFGHEGRPGQVGGSAPAEGGGGGGGGTSIKSKSGRTYEETAEERRRLAANAELYGAARKDERRAREGAEAAAALKELGNARVRAANKMNQSRPNSKEQKQAKAEYERLSKELSGESNLPVGALEAEEGRKKAGARASSIESKMNDPLVSEKEFSKLYKEREQAREEEVQFGNQARRAQREAKKSQSSANNALGRPLTAAEVRAIGSRNPSISKSSFENSPAGKIAKAVGKEKEFNDRIRRNMEEAPKDDVTQKNLSFMEKSDKTRQILSELRGESQPKFKSPTEEKEHYREAWRGAVDRMEHFGGLLRRRIKAGVSEDLIEQARKEHKAAKAKAIEFEKKFDSFQ